MDTLLGHQFTSAARSPQHKAVVNFCNSLRYMRILLLDANYGVQLLLVGHTVIIPPLPDNVRSSRCQVLPLPDSGPHLDSEWHKLWVFYTSQSASRLKCEQCTQQSGESHHWADFASLVGYLTDIL